MRSPRLPASKRTNKAEPQSESMSYKGRRDSFVALIDIIARLRGPDGCPWDREQTHLSLKPTLVEECYEVLEAVDEEDDKKLCEELGDLLMQIVLHAQIADDQGKFSIKDVLQGINTKLIHRHPHVFGEAKVSNSQEVILSWEALKQKERGVTPLLSGLPKGMPALAYSQALQRRAARVGFDWKDINGVIEKLGEEVEELRQSANPEERAREFGDVLFALTNVARWLDVESEEALRMANERFCRRFGYMEKHCLEQGIALSSLSLDQQNELWEDAKKAVS
jgi:tetrapyrrole methylase family protein/MazG family protein